MVSPEISEGFLLPGNLMIIVVPHC